MKETRPGEHVTLAESKRASDVSHPASDLKADKPFKGGVYSEDRPREMTNSVDKQAWENRGSIVAVKDGQNRTTRIEGWLERQSGDRTSADKKIQTTSCDGLQKRFDGGHLIGDGLGGPRIDSHGKDLASANIVPMDARMNRSFVEANERFNVRESLDRGESLYIRVDVRWDKDGRIPESITQSLYRRGADGSPEFRYSAMSVVGKETHYTLAEGVSPSGLTVRDYISPQMSARDRANSH